LKKEEVNPLTHYDNELALLNQTLKEIEDLYDETKEHFDAVRNSRTKGSLSFVHLQTANLVSLKNAKFQILKERISVRKNIADLSIKQKAGEGAEGKDKALVMQLLGAIMKNDTLSDVKNTVFEDEDEDEDIDTKLDRKLTDLEAKGKLEFTDNELATKNEKKQRDAQIVVLLNGKKWSFVAVDESNEIVKGFTLPDKTKFKMHLAKDDGEIIAVDQNDKVYNVIRK